MSTHRRILQSFTLIIVLACTPLPILAAATSTIEHPAIHTSARSAEKDLIEIYSADFQLDVAPNLPDNEGWTGLDLSGTAGDFAQVWETLRPLDGCAPNATAQLAFIDPTHPCESWCYNENQGTVPAATDLHNVFASPAIEWPGIYEQGALLQFDVYRHFPAGRESAGTGYVWYVRSVDTGNPLDLDSAPWLSRDLVYTGAPGYVTQVEDVSDLLVPGRTHVQLALGVRNTGPGPDWNGTDTPPAPYFDNVVLTAYPLDGPVIAAREADLAQDAFPHDQVLDFSQLSDNWVPFSAATNSATPPDNIPTDAITVEITPVNPGTSISGTPKIHYQLEPNELFDDIRTYPNTGGIPGTTTNGSTYTFDLEDEHFFYPGDVIHYYIEARDDFSGYATLPADISDMADFSPTSGYDKAFTVRALPTMLGEIPGEQPRILLWDDAPGSDGDAVWTTAFAQLGLVFGMDYDLYWTNDPAAGLDNGLGGRAAPNQIDGYDLIIYSSGDLCEHTLTDGSNASSDIDLLSNWVNAGNRNLLMGGNNLISDLEGGAAGNQFMTDILGVQLIERNIRPLINDQIWPLVESSYWPIYAAGTTWRVDGSEPGLNEFDAIEPVIGTSESVAEFTDPGGNTGAYSYSAMVLHEHTPMFNRIVTMPYDLEHVGEAKTLGGTAAANLVEGLLWFFNFIPGFGWAIPSVEFSSAVIPDSADDLSVFTLPHGDGDLLSVALDASGASANATIQVTVMNENQVPIVGFPATSITLWGGYPTVPGQDPIPSGRPIYLLPLHADGPTDEYGMTTISGAMHAGGYSDYPDEKLYVHLGPICLRNHPLDLYYKGSDLSGNLAVNLWDCVLFYIGYDGEKSCAWRFDHNNDGICNLIDLVIHAAVNPGYDWEY